MNFLKSVIAGELLVTRTCNQYKNIPITILLASRDLASGLWIPNMNLLNFLAILWIVTLFIKMKGGLYGMTEVHALYRVPSSFPDFRCLWEGTMQMFASGKKVNFKSCPCTIKSLTTLLYNYTTLSYIYHITTLSYIYYIIIYTDPFSIFAGYT